MNDCTCSVKTAVAYGGLLTS